MLYPIRDGDFLVHTTTSVIQHTVPVAYSVLRKQLLDDTDWMDHQWHEMNENERGTNEMLFQPTICHSAEVAGTGKVNKSRATGKEKQQKQTKASMKKE